MMRLGNDELEKMIHDISIMGQDLAQAESDYERFTLDMKYEINNALLNLRDTKMTLKEKEAAAFCTAEVTQLIEKIAEAKKRYISLRHKIKAREIWCDMFRSINSKNKREMKFYQDMD